MKDPVSELLVRRTIGVVAIAIGGTILYEFAKFFFITPTGRFSSYGSIQFWLAIFLVVFGGVLLFKRRKT